MTSKPNDWTSPWVKLVRVVISEDSDQLDAALVTLHMHGHTDWKKGIFMGQHQVHKCIVSQVDAATGFTFTGQVWPIISRFDVETIGRQPRRYFAEEQS